MALTQKEIVEAFVAGEEIKEFPARSKLAIVKELFLTRMSHNAGVEPAHMRLPLLNSEFLSYGEEEEEIAWRSPSLRAPIVLERNHTDSEPAKRLRSYLSRRRMVDGSTVESLYHALRDIGVAEGWRRLHRNNAWDQGTKWLTGNYAIFGNSVTYPKYVPVSVDVKMWLYAGNPVFWDGDYLRCAMESIGALEKPVLKCRQNGSYYAEQTEGLFRRIRTDACLWAQKPEGIDGTKKLWVAATLEDWEKPLRPISIDKGCTTCGTPFTLHQTQCLYCGLRRLVATKNGCVYAIEGRGKGVNGDWGVNGRCVVIHEYCDLGGMRTLLPKRGEDKDEILPVTLSLDIVGRKIDTVDDLRPYILEGDIDGALQKEG